MYIEIPNQADAGYAHYE